MSRLVQLAGQLVDRIKINTLCKERRGDRNVWIKQRRSTAAIVLAGANAFFRSAGAPLRALADIPTWQQWELESFQRLHGSDFRAFIPGPRAIAFEELPGINLTLFLDGGTITPKMAASAGRELRRAHSTHCPEFNGAWSHGDPHLGNFVYEPESDRCRLIDFEVIHHKTLSAHERHLDDLLVFLQDMGGRIRQDLWLPCAQAFLAAYDDQELSSKVLTRLTPPHPLTLARLWWIVRTSYLSPSEWQQRVAQLQAPTPQSLQPSSR